MEGWNRNQLQEWFRERSKRHIGLLFKNLTGAQFIQKYNEESFVEVVSVYESIEASRELYTSLMSNCRRQQVNRRAPSRRQEPGNQPTSIYTQPAPIYTQPEPIFTQPENLVNDFGGYDDEYDIAFQLQMEEYQKLTNSHNNANNNPISNMIFQMSNLEIEDQIARDRQFSKTLEENDLKKYEEDFTDHEYLKSEYCRDLDKIKDASLANFLLHNLLGLHNIATNVKQFEQTLGNRILLQSIENINLPIVEPTNQALFSKLNFQERLLVLFDFTIVEPNQTDIDALYLKFASLGVNILQYTIFGGYIRDYIILGEKSSGIDFFVGENPKACADEFAALVKDNFKIKMTITNGNQCFIGRFQNQNNEQGEIKFYGTNNFNNGRNVDFDVNNLQINSDFKLHQRVNIGLSNEEIIRNIVSKVYRIVHRNDERITKMQNKNNWRELQQ